MASVLQIWPTSTARSGHWVRPALSCPWISHAIARCTTSRFARSTASSTLGLSPASKELRSNLGPIGSRGSLFRPEGPERDRVAQAVHGRDAVLPVGSGSTLKQVGRAWLEYEGAPLPSRACFAPQSKHTPGQQREADHLSKHRLVLVPANPSTGSVLGQKNLLQVGRSKPGEHGRAFAQVQQKRGQV